MKNKKKILFLLLASLIIIIILSTFIISSVFKLFKNTAAPNSNFYIDESWQVYNCKNDKNCETYNYHTIGHSNKNKELQTVISNINREVKQKYNQDINGKTENNNACSSVVDKYKYSTTSLIDYNLYENEKYISITYKIYDINFCNDTSKVTDPIVYIFSKKDNKIITQEQFKKELNVTEEQINNNISSYLQSLNSSNNTKYSLEYNNKNGKPVSLLFYNQEGKLSIYFYQSIDDTYQTTTI